MMRRVAVVAASAAVQSTRAGVAAWSLSSSLLPLSIVRRFATATSASNATSSSPQQTAAGFEAIGVRCGIKKKPNVSDFCLIRSSAPCSGAALFTQNRFCAAPVLVSKRIIQQHSDNVGGVAINAGCANACTGDRGLSDANTMVDLASSVANIPNAIVMSTGVIGPFLPMDKIKAGFESATKEIKAGQGKGQKGWQAAAEAIMTTDTVPKVLHRTASIDGRSFTLSGICKGAGMIHPNMATMLSCIATDISISPAALQNALAYATERSFNAISIDNDTSTNDTIALLANGQADAWKAKAKGQYGQCIFDTNACMSDLLRAGNVTTAMLTLHHAMTACHVVAVCNTAIDSTSSPHFTAFRDILTSYCINLAQRIVRDGEGATKFVTIIVSGGSSYDDCKTIAKSIANSMLVKTALFGQDANWGRILCATGYAGVKAVQPEKVNLFIHPNETVAAKAAVAQTGRESSKSTVTATTPADSIGTLHLVRNGQPYDTNEAHATALFKRNEIVLQVDLGLGKESATVWTCDLSKEYVAINGDYRS